MSKYIFYPGCAMETSARAYNESLMAIHEVLGIELEEIRDWTAAVQQSTWGSTSCRPTP